MLLTGTGSSRESSVFFLFGVLDLPFFFFFGVGSGLLSMDFWVFITVFDLFFFGFFFFDLSRALMDFSDLSRFLGSFY
jgi:hypothetical protein